MQLVDQPITRSELQKMSERFFGGLVKAVVDVEKEIMVIDAPMHADCEKELLDSGSLQDNLWGINVYPDLEGDDFVEFDSMINVRPRKNNFTRGIDNEELQKKITSIVKKLIL